MIIAQAWGTRAELAADADDAARGALLLLGRTAYGLICISTQQIRVTVRPSGAVAELRTPRSSFRARISDRRCAPRAASDSVRPPSQRAAPPYHRAAGRS